MIALLQRVARADVTLEGRRVAAIEAGILALFCAERSDTVDDVDALLGKVLRLRMFGDAGGKMNLNVAQVGGGLLLVPQFTLAADTDSGARPSFTPAAAPSLGRALFDAFVAAARARHPRVEVGVFGADMQVSLVNDGPVTFWLQVGRARTAVARQAL